MLFAPHFAEYAARLAAALAACANVLLVTEARNHASECEGLSIGGGPNLRRISYRGDYALRNVSLLGFRERRRIYRAIEAFAPDVVHIQEQGDTFTASLAKRFARSRPVVETVHDPLPHSGSDAFVAQRFARGLDRIRAVASAYHVHGAYCEAALRNMVETDKPIVSTPHGMILVPSAAGRAPAENRCLFFGRMEAYKGLDVLLDAIDLLPEDQGLTFVLAGRGPELERLRSRLAAYPAIELIDKYLPPLEAIREFQRARFVVVPYRDATQSGVISAAMGSGKPVVASRVGGLADAVTEDANGLLVPPGDPAALAAAIGAMMDDALCRRLGEGAQAAAAGRFAWESIAAALLDLYVRLLPA